MAVIPDSPLPADRSSPPARAVGDPRNRSRSTSAEAARRGAMRRAVLIAGCAVGAIGLVVLFVVIGETAAAAPHPRSTGRPADGASSAAELGGAAAVFLAVAIVVTAVVVALRLVFPRTDPAATLRAEIDAALDTETPEPPSRGTGTGDD